MTISGAHFSGATVKFDFTSTTPLSQNDSEVRLQTPKHDNGYALIQIGGAAAEFLYLPPKLEDLPPGFITTVAGVGRYLRLEMPATQAAILPSDLTIAANGEIYFAQVDRGRVFRIDTAGILHHFAGTLGPLRWDEPSDNRPAVDASFKFSRSVALDAAGNAYITDTTGRIRRVDHATGIVTTVAGTGEIGYSGDGGPATQAKIGEPAYIACAPDGTLYFIEGLPIGANGGGSARNLRVRKVTPDGIITTVAGNGNIGDEGDGGLAVNASLNIGTGDDGDIAIDSDQNVFIAELDGKRIRRVDARTGIITNFASLVLPGTTRNNIFHATVATDTAGNVYAATAWNFFKFDSGGHLLDSWGMGGGGFSEDGTPAKQMNGSSCWGMAVAANGDIVFSDGNVRRIRKINMATGRLETVAGIAPNVIGVPGKALGAEFLSAYSDLVFLPSGGLLFSDAAENWIFRIDLHSGTVSPFAGTGMFSGQYEESPAALTGMEADALECDARGNVYFVDKQTVRVIDPDGIVHRVAGVSGGQYGFSGDAGPARDALLCQPNDVTLDANGNLYIADTNNNRIRRVDNETGIITTVAGSGPPNGFEGYRDGSFCGDGGPATSACMNTPTAVAVRRDGTMYINDFFGNLRKVTPEGIISSIPSPQRSKLIIGPGESVFATGPREVFRLDHDRLRIIAGTGTAGFSGDGGPAIDAEISPPFAEWGEGLAIDTDGNLYFHDAGNVRIRAVRYGAVLAPTGATVQATGSGSTIRTMVLDATGETAPGVRVDFSAPDTGASCMLSSPFAITDQNGVASVSCTPNCVEGSYSVTAQPLTAASTARVTFTNLNGPCRRRAVHH